MTLEVCVEPKAAPRLDLTHETATTTCHCSFLGILLFDINTGSEGTAEDIAGTGSHKQASEAPRACLFRDER